MQTEETVQNTLQLSHPRCAQVPHINAWLHNETAGPPSNHTPPGSCITFLVKDPSGSAYSQ